MSDSIAIARTFAVTQASATQQVMETLMLRQQAQADQAVVALIQQSVEQTQAILQDGQGRAVDITA